MAWPENLNVSYPKDPNSREAASLDLDMAVFGIAVAVTFCVLGLGFLVWGFWEHEKLLGSLILFCIGGAFYLISKNNEKKALLKLKSIEKEETAAKEAE